MSVEKANLFLPVAALIFAVTSSFFMPVSYLHDPTSAARLRSMSAPEVRDAVERADIEARVRKWTRNNGSGHDSAVLRQKLQEIEAKAIFLSKKAEKYRKQKVDALATPYVRAAAESKYVDYRRKYEKALRVCALLEDKCRSYSPLRSQSLTYSAEQPRRRRQCTLSCSAYNDRACVV